MATDLERLVVALEARTAAFEKAMNRANGVAQKQGRSIEAVVKRTSRNATAEFTAFGKSMLGAFAGVAALRGAQQLVDSATRIENALKVAGLSGDQLTKVQDRLFQSAQRNAAPWESLVELFSRASLVQKELGVSTEEMLGFTDKVAVALRVSGKSAQESRGALLQLSQALGSGIVRAEEFNSIIEGATPIAQAAAAGLTEAGGSVARLRQLVVAGKVSSEAFFRAFEAGAVILDEKVAGAELTVSQGFIRLQNVLIATAGRMDKVTGASSAVVSAINAISSALEQFEGSRLEQAIQGTVEAQRGLQESTQRLVEDPSWENFIDALFFGTPDSDLKRQTDAQADAVDRLRESLTKLPAIAKVPAGAAVPQSERITNMFQDAFAPGVKPVSLSDFAAPNAPGGAAGGRGNPWEREQKQWEERIALLDATSAAQRTLNPLVDDYGFTIEKVKVQQELLNAAKAAGVADTDELRGAIDLLAGRYATASVEAAKLTEAQDRIRDSAKAALDTAKDAMRGFIDDLRQGTSVAEALGNALNRVADRLLDSVFSGIGGTGGGIFGAIGKLFGFAGGGFTGAGGKYQPAGIVHRGEYVFDQAATKRIGVGNLEAMRRGALPGYANGGYVTAPRTGGGTMGGVSVTVVQDNRGVDPQSVARLEANQPRLIKAAVREAMASQQEAVRVYGVRGLGAPQ